MFRKSVLSVVLFFLFFSFLHSQQTVEGFVFVDKNYNGQWDKGEKKMQNILISNGDTIIKTDKNGYYQLKSSENDIIFPILPSKYKLAPQGIESRHFHITSTSQKSTHNFAFLPSTESNKLKVAIVGDVQVKNMDELYYAQTTIFSELADNKAIDFAVFMGDLSNDNDTILLKMRDCIERLPFSSWNVIGNHDLNKTKPRTSSLFKNLFGTDIFAFFKGEVCFIAINNVENNKGAISASQLRFIRNLISYLPNTITPIICQHIPLYSTSNRAELLQVIGERKCLILSAHSHNVSRHFWNEWVHEWVVGASCGSWWTGEVNQNSIPLALQQCGTPRNYFLLDIDKKQIDFQFKGINLDCSYQMDIWIKGQNKTDDSIPALKGLPDRTVIANIFAGGDSTLVEYSIDNGKWENMQQTPMTAPAVSKIVEWNKMKYYPTPHSKRLAVRNRATKHIWSCALPELSLGFHQIKIRASDKFGLAPIEQTQIFYISNK